MQKITAQAAVVNYRSPNAQLYHRLAVIATACCVVFCQLPIFYMFIAGMNPGLVEALLFAASTLSLLFVLIALQAYRFNRVRRLVFSDGGISFPSAEASGRRSMNLIPWNQIEKIAVEKDGSGVSS